MKKSIIRKTVKESIFSVLFLVTLLGAGDVHAVTEKPKWAPDMSAALTFETKYIWRGQNMVDNPVLQPEASIGKYGLTFYYWGNVDMDTSQQRWTEHDYTIDYTFNLGDTRNYLGMTKTDDLGFLDPLWFSFGNIFYVFPQYSGKDFHTEEFYLGIRYDCFLQPSFKWYIDYARGAGSYLQLGVGHTFDVGGGMNAKINVVSAYNAGQWGYGYKLAPLLLSGEVNIPIFGYFTITPNMNYSVALDRSWRGDLAYGSEFYGGVKASVSF